MADSATLSAWSVAHCATVSASACLFDAPSHGRAHTRTRACTHAGVARCSVALLTDDKKHCLGVQMAMLKVCQLYIHMRK